MTHAAHWEGALTDVNRLQRVQLELRPQWWHLHLRHTQALQRPAEFLQKRSERRRRVERDSSLASFFDVLIGDISELDVFEIGIELDVKRLAEGPDRYPISGLFWHSISNRTFLQLTVKP